MHFEMKDIFRHSPGIETKRPPALQRDLAIRFRKEENAILLINQVDRNIYRLNKTAGDIFLLCDGQHATQDIIDEMMKKYEGDADRTRTAIINTLEDLIQKGMVKIIEKPGEPEDTVFLHREGSTDSYRLNSTMSFIWRSVNGERRVEDIISFVEETYQVPHEKAEKAVSDAVEYFLSESLLEKVNP